MNQESYEMNQESYEKWYPVKAVPTCLGGAFLITFDAGTLVVLCHSSGRDILLKFESVLAYQVHEEFAHPWMDHQSPSPKSEDSSYTFPFLEVNESIWLNSFSEGRLIRLINKRLHLQIVTQSEIVDVLCDDYPQASLIGQEATERLIGTLTTIETLLVNEDNA